MMNKLNVEYISVETLIPYINNPRRNDKAIDIVAYVDFKNIINKVRESES